jgi:hypothetical protein
MRGVPGNRHPYRDTQRRRFFMNLLISIGVSVFESFSHHSQINNLQIRADFAEPISQQKYWKF